MTRSRSTIVLVMFLFGICLCIAPSLAEGLNPQPALPAPFDDPKPKIPKEIVADKRLDQKLDVFVKSSNLRELCADLSRETGVRITARCDIAGERPIIYFHHRTVRDVMTEISGLYGFFWLVKGKEGSYSYELFEDSRHVQKRERGRTERTDALNAALFDAIDQGCAAMDDPIALQKMAKDSPPLFESVTRSDLKALLGMICKMDRSTIWGYLRGDKPARLFPELPTDQQQGILEFINASSQRVWEDAQRQGKTAPEPRVRTAEDMASVIVVFKASVGGVDSNNPPHICLRMADSKPGGGLVILQEWPLYSWDEPLLEDIAPGKAIGDPLPKQKVKPPNPRKTWYGSGLLLGDVLEAIGMQTDLDIIADYYLQNQLYPAQERLLDELAGWICLNFDYTCQVDGKTLRFRCNRWFDRQPLKEPPADLLNRLQKAVDTSGTVDYDDILDIAALTDEQVAWPGYRFIPGAEMAQRGTGTLRLWRSLSPSFKFDANQTATVLVTDLMGPQQDMLYSWMKLMGSQESVVDLARSMITVAILGSDSKSYELVLHFPDGKTRTMRIDLGSTFPPISEELRKDLAARRLADADADKVVLIK